MSISVLDQWHNWTTEADTDIWTSTETCNYQHSRHLTVCLEFTSTTNTDSRRHVCVSTLGITHTDYTQANIHNEDRNQFFYNLISLIKHNLCNRHRM